MTDETEGAVSMELRPYVHILGVIDGPDRVRVTSVARLVTRNLVGPGRQTSYFAQLVSESGTVIADAPVFDFPLEGQSPDDDAAAMAGNLTFRTMIPDLGGDAIRIVHDGEVVWERTRPDVTPVLGRAEAKLDGKLLRISWEWEVAPKDEPDVWVRWAREEEAEAGAWHALTVGLGPSPAEVDVAEILPSGPIVFQVMAHDGFNTVTAVSEPVVVPPRAPVVSILHPREGEVLQAGGRIHLRGLASVPEGVELPDDDFVWTLDGKEVARGRSAWVAHPGEGEHRIRLAVTAEGGTGDATVTVGAREG
jgi:hypothetical protein